MAASAHSGTHGLAPHGPAPPLNRIAAHGAVFLDFDGTLVHLAPRPDQVLVDAALRGLLNELFVATGGATALVSGRGLEDLDALLGPLRLPLAGVHGAERRRPNGIVERFAVPAPVIWQTRMALRLRLRRYPRLLVEDKGCAFAVHYRGVPDVPVARLRLDLQALAGGSGGHFELLEGSEVFELRPQACNKGSAVAAFMAEPPFAGRLPIFIGDDQTDLAGFAAVTRANGMAIAVGPRVTARWWLPDPGAVRAWLRGCLGLAH